MTSYLMAIVMFALSITIYEIFGNEMKYVYFDFENESKDQRRENRDLHHSTGNVQFFIGDFF